MELIFIRPGFAFKAVLFLSLSPPHFILSLSLWLLILWLAAWRFKLQLCVSSLIISPAPLLSPELMFASNSEDLARSARNNFRCFILSCVFWLECVVCSGPAADPNTVQIDGMITVLNRLLLGLDSLSLSSLHPVHQCQYGPDGWGADNIRVSRFIFSLSDSIVPSPSTYTPLKAIESRYLAWEGTFDLTETCETITWSRDPRWCSGPFMYAYRGNVGICRGVFR